MDREEKILGLLRILAEMSSERQEAVALSKLLRKTVIPSPTVYMLVGLAVKKGLVVKEGGHSRKFLTITSEGYKLLDIKTPEKVETPRKGLSYKQGFALLEQIALIREFGASETKDLIDSIKKLIIE